MQFKLHETLVLENADELSGLQLHLERKPCLVCLADVYRLWHSISHANNAREGSNRGDNNRTNTFEAIMAAKQRALDYIWAVEIGNEPDRRWTSSYQASFVLTINSTQVYLLLWNKPVAVTPWNDTQEGQDAADWIQQFIDTWGESLPKISAGAYAIPYEYPAWPNTNHLINEAFNETVKSAVSRYCTHLYTLSEGTSLAADMAHMQTVSDVSHFVEKIAAAKSEHRPYIIGE